MLRPGDCVKTNGLHKKETEQQMAAPPRTDPIMHRTSEEGPPRVRMEA